jgi:Uma2 family endonuclease
MERMGNPALAPHERFTYRHYRTWPDTERWELIEGQAWNMSPAPLRKHQKLQHRLVVSLGNFLKGKPCEVYEAPFDVLLPAANESDDDVDTVVQPDIVVYCDTSKLTRAGARGAPDLAVEILSPSTAHKDQKEKFDLYERHGVREYWVVDPAGEWLCIYRLARGKDGRPRFDSGELREPVRDYSPVASSVLAGFTVDPAELFADLG